MRRPTPVRECEHRCKPACGECLDGAWRIARGHPVGDKHTLFEHLWITGFVGAAIALYLFAKHLPVEWFVIAMLAAVVSFVVGLAGPHQFRVYREAQRAEKGVCAACGYAIATLAGEPVTRKGSTFNLVACPECAVWNGRRIKQAARRSPGR